MIRFMNIEAPELSVFIFVYVMKISQEYFSEKWVIWLRASLVVYGKEMGEKKKKWYHQKLT